MFSPAHNGRLAYTQLGSFGSTYAGMGLDKTMVRAWRILGRAGLPVPQFVQVRTDRPKNVRRAVRGLGWPMAVTSLSGAFHRVVKHRRELDMGVEHLRERGQHTALVTSPVPEESFRALVHRGEVRALMGSRRSPLNSAEVAARWQNLAVAAVDAFPGLDLARVTVRVSSLREATSSAEAHIQRIAHYPHIRDFAGGSRRTALELGSRLLEEDAAAADVVLRPAARDTRVVIDFTGGSAAEEVREGLGELVADLPGITGVSSDDPVSDRLRSVLQGTPADIGFAVTRSIAGLPNGASAHMVQTTPFAE